MIYQGINFDGINISGTTSHGRLIVSAKEDFIQLNDSLVIRNVLLNGNANRDSAYFNLLISNTDSSISKINIGFDMLFPGNGVTSIKVIPSLMLVDYNKWTLDSTNNLLIDTSGITVNNFNFHSGDQSLTVAGKMSRNLNDKIAVSFSKFNVAVINSLLKIYDTEIGGIVNGTAEVSSVYHKPAVNADLSVSQFSLFNDTLGDAKIS